MEIDERLLLLLASRVSARLLIKCTNRHKPSLFEKSECHIPALTLIFLSSLCLADDRKVLTYETKKQQNEPRAVLCGPIEID
jgi:hypothetical protein